MGFIPSIVLGDVGLAKEPAPTTGIASIGLTMPSVFSVTPGTLVSNGTFAVAFVVQPANRILAGPPTGADAAPTFRALVAADLSTSGTADATTALHGDMTWKTVYTDPLTTDGDILARIAGSTTRLAVGTSGQVLTVSVGGLPTWATPSSGFADPMTTIGDMIFRNGTNTTTRLPVGTDGQFLRVTGGIPTWTTTALYSDPLTTNGDIVARIAGVTTRLGIGTAGQVLGVSSGLPAWIAPPAAGSNQQVQYNASGSLAGSSALSYDSALTRFNGNQLTASQPFLAIQAHGSVSTDVLRLTGSGVPSGGAYISVSSSTTGLNAWIAGNIGTINYAIIGYSSNASNFPLGGEWANSATTGYRVALRLNGEPSSAPSADFGIGTLFALRTSTSSRVDAGYHGVAWSTTTHASRTSYHVWQVVNSASALTEAMRLTGDGTLRVGTASIYFGLRPAGSGTPIWTMPSADGTSNQVLTTNGSGVLSWSTITAGAGGSTTQVQYNNAGALAGSANFVWDNTNGTLGIRATPGTTATLVVAPQSASTGGISISGSTSDRIAFVSNSGTGLGAWIQSAGTSGILKVRSSGTLAGTGILDVDTTNLNTASSAFPIAVFSVNTSTTPVAGFGQYLSFRAQSSTSSNRDMGELRFTWSTATDASRTATFSVLLVRSATAAAEVFLIAGEGNQTQTITTTVFDTVVANVSRIRSTTAATNGFGLRNTVQLETTTTNDVDAAMFNVTWSDATHTSRTATYSIGLAWNAAVTPTSSLWTLSGDGNIFRYLYTTTNTSIINAETLRLGTTGSAPAAGFGTSHLVQLHDSAYGYQDASRFVTVWDVATSGSQRGLIGLEISEASAWYRIVELTRTSGGNYSLNIPSSTGIVRINGTQVLQARITGWAPQSIGGSRADFGIAPTLNQVASAVAQLQADLTTHGIIGA